MFDLDNAQNEQKQAIFFVGAEMHRKGEKMNKGGFSWKRLLGITKMKRKISKAIGIPLTRSGRQRKFGKFFGIK